MIIHIPKSVDEGTVDQLAQKHQAAHFDTEAEHVLVTPSKVQELHADFAELATAHFAMKSDIQLASRDYMAQTREIRINETVIGGDSGHTLMITGPCSVESWEQISQSAQLLKSLNLTTLRAGSYKPRTTPYGFQGLGKQGLELLEKVRQGYGLNIITEVRDAGHVQDVIASADIVQIGAKAMYDHGILRACGAMRKPVLLKRGFGSTLQDVVQAAEFILSGGNPNVMLCERGIRTFETKTRFTLDICGAAWLKEYTNLPIVLDPSHAMGARFGVPDVARACAALGVDGLLIETHPTPDQALSDAAQQLSHEQFIDLFESLGPIVGAVGRRLI